MLLFKDVKVFYRCYYDSKSFPTGSCSEFSKLISCAVKVENGISMGSSDFEKILDIDTLKCHSFLRMALDH